MFVTPTSTGSGPADSAWLDNSHSMMLDTQAVLDYFSDSDSPVLSLESFSSQHSPDLDAYCFDDFATSTASTSPSSTPFAAFQSASSISAVPNVDNISMVAPIATAKPLASETARQAALLHAYLAAQSQSSAAQLHQQQQKQWAMSFVAQNDQYQQARLKEQKDLEEKKKQQEEEQERQKATAHVEQLIKIQQADAQNLARFLARSKEIKKEDSVEPTAMEEDSSVSCPQSPSSTSFSSDEKSPSASPTMAERSLSPEVQTTSSTPAKNSANAKANRQLECFNCKVTQTPLWRRTPDRKHSLCNACGLYYKQYGAHRPLHVRHKLPTVMTDMRTMPYARPSSQSSRGSSPTLEVPFVFSSPSSAAPDSSASSSSDSDSDSGVVHHSLQSFPDLTKMYTEALMRPPVQKTTPPLMTAKQGIECANCSQTQTPLWRKNEAGEPICNACGLYAKLHNRDRPVTMRKTKITRRRRDWGGNLAHQAQAQAQALAFAHAQAQAQAQAQALVEAANDNKAGSPMSSVSDSDQSMIVATIVEEMNRKAQALMSRTSASSASSVHSSDSEEEECPRTPSPSPSPAPSRAPTMSVPAATPAPAPTTSSGMSNNIIMDETKFSDMVCQMNAHQMNRFLSILETRCGVLRERLLASTDAGSQPSSSLDHLF
ncbi:hypothetical protein BG004_002148 [Podila humilis]|nr:hypothetical protein BG004_002148 [Podila humilis]